MPSEDLPAQPSGETGAPVEDYVANPPASPRTIVRIGSGSAYQVAAQVITLGVGFLTSILVARTLGPSGKGQLSVLQQIPAVLAVLLSFGVASSNLYFVGRGKHAPGVVLGNSLIIASLAGIVGAPLVWLLAAGRFAVLPGLPGTGTLAAMIVLPTSLSAGFVIAIANGLGMLKRTSLIHMSAAVITFVMVSATYLSGHLSVTAVLVISVVSSLISLALAYLAIRSHVSAVRVRLAEIRESASYSLKSHLGNLAGYLNYRSDILLLGYLQDAAAVGVYSIAVTFAELMWYVPNALATSVLAKTIQISAEEGGAVSARTARLASMIMLLVCFVAAILIGPVVSLVYGSAFTPAIRPFFALLPGVWCMGIAKIASGYLAGTGRVYPAISAGAAGVNIAANLILIPVTGVTGAAVASTLSYLLLAVAMMGIFSKHTGIGWLRLVIPDRDDLRALGSAAARYMHALLQRR